MSGAAAGGVRQWPARAGRGSGQDVRSVREFGGEKKVPAGRGPLLRFPADARPGVMGHRGTGGWTVRIASGGRAPAGAAAAGRVLFLAGGVDICVPDLWG